MKPTQDVSQQSTWRDDALASLVVFLVAVPLSLGIAFASGAPVTSGLIAAAVGGIFVGFFGGAPLQVSGPAAGLTVIVFGMIQQFGWPVMGLITVLGGLIQFIIARTGTARTALAITPAVVHGMLAGIGVVITLAQLHVVFGGKPETHAIDNLRDLPERLSTLHTPSTILGVITIAITLGWGFLPKKVQAIPAALVAIATATAVASFMQLKVARVDLPGDLRSSLALPGLPRPDQWGAVALAAVVIALVASVESLLSAVATDKQHSGPRADLDRELSGQGLGNMVSGLIGGLPITGVIVRSSANVAAGAKTRNSAILHGVWVLVFAALFSPFLELIPLSALAGLLVVVGVRLVKMEHIEELKRHRELPIYLLTVLGVVAQDLLVGVGLGLAASIVLLLRRLAQMEVKVSEQEDGWHVALNGSLTFVTVPKLSAELSRIPQGATVLVEMHTDFMDHAAFEALHAWEDGHRKSGGEVQLDELHDDWYHLAVHETPKRRRTRLRTPQADSIEPAPQGSQP